MAVRHICGYLQRLTADTTYDKANRLLGADFSEFNSGLYTDNAAMNFDVRMGDGVDPFSAYDANGNIKAMTQYGNLQSPLTPIDQLTYHYFDHSNKLGNVSEPGTTVIDNHLGDFTDRNKSGNDYGYDKNGNLIVDKNKGINGAAGSNDLDQISGGAIVYNHLNLPYRITVEGKGTITYTYDAGGNKLEKRVEELGSGSNPAKDTRTSYVAGMVYENNVLQFIAHEEGRLRIKTESSVTTFNYDYFIKDHLGNVRMMLTDEKFAPELYQATMETNRQEVEVAAFGEKVNTTKTPKSVHPGFDKDKENKMISAVNGSSPESSVGPGLVLKVKAGDKINARCFAWYSAEGDKEVDKRSLANVASTLSRQLLSGLGAAGKSLAAGASPTDGLAQELASFMNTQESAPAVRPKAYLNWVTFDDEKLAKVDANSGFRAVPNNADMATEGKQALIGDEIEITRNGYLYVFVSNESRQNVYFDDLTVEYTSGPLLEETHYYPFGLTMAGISSNAAVGTENKYKFNDGTELANKEFSDGSGLELYETSYRTYDPQIGRFGQIDPLNWSPNYSPYSFVQNNPLLYNDPLGLDTITTTGKRGDVIVTTNSKDNQVSTKINEDGSSEQTETLGSVTVTAKTKHHGATESSSSNIDKVTKAIQATVLVLALDDATRIGVVDDVAIPVLEIINGGLILYDFITKAEDKTDHMGKPKGNTPGNNQAQNQQVNSLVKKYKLSREEQRKLHDRISGEGYGYKEIEEIIKSKDY